MIYDEKIAILKGTTWKKDKMKNTQHGNSRGVARTPQTSKMESFATIFNVCGSPRYNSWKSAT